MSVDAGAMVLVHLCSGRCVSKFHRSIIRHGPVHQSVSFRTSLFQAVTPLLCLLLPHFRHPEITVHHFYVIQNRTMNATYIFLGGDAYVQEWVEACAYRNHATPLRRCGFARVFVHVPLRRPGLGRCSACVSPVQMASRLVRAGAQGVLLAFRPANAEGRHDRGAFQRK